MIYYFCQWALTVVVIRFSSAENTGILQLSMTIANIFASIANYNMRTFQISDLHDQFTSGEYIAARLITCCIALAGNIIYCLFWHYDPYLIVCIAVYMIYRLNESLADVFHAIDQRHMRMDHVLISFSFRGIVMLFLFTLILVLTQNILLALSAIAVSSLLIVFLYDRYSASRYEPTVPTFIPRKICFLLLTCLPAVLSSSAFAAIVTVPRQILARLLSDEVLGFYATAATPLIIVQVLANSMIYPQLGEIAKACDSRETKAVRKRILRLALLVITIGSIALITVYLLGEFGLVILYGEKMRQYASLLPAITLCTILYVYCDICMNTLIILRKLGLLLVISLGGLITAASLALPFIGRFGENGVSYSVLIAYAVFSFLGTLSIHHFTGTWSVAAGSSENCSS